MTLKFIDLFAGIGGFHLGMEEAGARCVFASEKDIFARITYEANFRADNPELFPRQFAGDITEVHSSQIPDFDVLCGGFPCQPFSNAGHKKGFEDTRGTLFFHIARILQEKKPKAFFLENVRGLLNHDNGATFKVIEETLRNLGYTFHAEVIKGTHFGFPQLRPRLYMVGFLANADNFHFPTRQELKFTMSDVFKGDCHREIGFTLRCGGRGSGVGDRRNWDCYLVDGQEVKLGIVEAKQLQGFPSEYKFPVSETQAMKQLGNAVMVPAIEAIGRQIRAELDRLAES